MLRRITDNRGLLIVKAPFYVAICKYRNPMDQRYRRTPEKIILGYSSVSPYVVRISKSMGKRGIAGSIQGTPGNWVWNGHNDQYKYNDDSVIVGVKLTPGAFVRRDIHNVVADAGMFEHYTENITSGDKLTEFIVSDRLCDIVTGFPIGDIGPIMNYISLVQSH